MIAIAFVGQSNLVMILQYFLIGAIFLSGMVYLSSQNYANEIKALRLNQANDELNFLSTHDPLTCINNRHSLHIYLAEKLPEFQAKEVALGFVMLDVDSFKKYNDTLSHVKGDECLQIIVDSIKKARLFPDEDFYRFGGDEFLILLPEVSPQDIQRVGEGIVKAVYARQLPSAKGAPYPFVSVSVGGYLTPADSSKNLDDYLAEADKQLYLAKNAGYNRFFFLDQEIYSSQRK